MPKFEAARRALEKNWSSKSHDDPGLFSGFRLRRALRIVPISLVSVQQVLRACDTVVQKIEECWNKKANGQSIVRAWSRNPGEEATCTVCDSRTYCPDFQQNYAKKTGEKQPGLPFVSV